MPRTTTTKKHKRDQYGLSVRIDEATYERLEKIRDTYPTRRRDDCLRAALGAWDACTEAERQKHVLAVVKSRSSSKS